MSALLERPAISGSRPPVPPRRRCGLAHGPLDDDNEPDYPDNPAGPGDDFQPEWVPLFSSVSPMILYAIDEIGRRHLTVKTPPSPPTPALIALFNEQTDLPEDQI